MAVPVWRLTKGAVQYSAEELKVYHGYDDCHYPLQIKDQNREKDTVQVFGEPLKVTDEDGKTYLLKPCDQCLERWGDNWFNNLIRHIRAPWQRRRE